MKFTVPQIMQFILQHYDRARDWDSTQLFNWICWNISQGFCLLVGEGNHIFGLMLVRPTMHPCSDCVGTLEFDPEGDTYFIDLAIATKPRRAVLQALTFAVLHRFGQRDKAAWQHHGIGPVIVVDAHEHRRRLLRSLYYGHTQRT